MKRIRLGKRGAVSQTLKHSFRYIESLEQRVLLTASLTHEYAFSFGTMADNVGAAPGTVTGGAVINSTGAGLELPGTASQGVNANYASIPVSDLSGLASATIEGWFTVGTQEASSQIFAAGQNLNSYIAITASVGTSGTAQLEFKPTGWNEVDTPATPYALKPGTEYYFAAVIDSGAETMSFCMGTGGSESLVGSVSLATANDGSPGNLTQVNFVQAFIGRSLLANQDFNGSIQDLRIYNGPLTGAQIAAAAAAGPDAPLTNTDPFGVGGSAEASGDYNTYLPAMESAGAAWFRAARGPASPSQGVWDWSSADPYNANVKADNLYETGMLDFSMPAWLKASDPNGLSYVNTPSELSWYASYVTQSVTHLKGQVAQWEIGNEAQNAGISPAGYAAIVETAYNAAKAVDPNAQIGISVASVDINYIEQVIEDGAANHFNFIIVHPYEVAGTISDGQEADYMHIVPTIQAMLAADDPAEANAPVWVTEVGAQAAPGNMPQLVTQATSLWQIYTMGIAEGFSHIDWFDAQGADPYNEGLLTSSGTPNPAYYALQTLTGQLGADPKYLGWVQLNSVDYGFVFQGASGIVMATWAPPGSGNIVNFGQTVQIRSVDPSTGLVDFTSAASYALQPEVAVLVSGLSSSNSIVVAALNNASQPFPWNGNHTNSASVSVTMGATNVDAGVHQLVANGSSTAATFGGTAARFAGKSAYQTFTVDPNFLAYTPTPIQISVVVGSAPGANAGFNLVYESTSTSRSTGIGWNNVPGDGTWHTITFSIANDEFDSDWGYNFSLSSDSTTYSQYYIQSVTVTKIPPAAPGNLIATAASSSEINLTWNTVSGATSYDVYRGTSAGGESATPIATGLTSTSFADSLLSAGTKYYYIVKAVEGDAISAASNEASATTSSGTPAAPTGLAASGVSTSQINLSWTAVTGATSYSIYRGSTSGGESATAIATGITTTSYPNMGLLAGTRYYYTVKAVNNSGTSSASNEASMLTLAASGSASVNFNNGASDFTSNFTVSANPGSGNALAWVAGLGIDDQPGPSAGGAVQSTGGANLDSTAVYTPGKFNLSDDAVHTVSTYVTDVTGLASGDKPVQIGFLASGSTRFNNGMSFISARILANGTVEFQYANGSTAVSLMNAKPTGTVQVGDWLQLVFTTQELASGSFTGTFSLIDHGPTGMGAGTVVLAPVAYSISGLTNMGTASGVSAGFRSASSATFKGRILFDDFSVSVSTLAAPAANVNFNKSASDFTGNFAVSANPGSASAFAWNAGAGVQDQAGPSAGGAVQSGGSATVDATAVYTPTTFNLSDGKMHTISAYVTDVTGLGAGDKPLQIGFLAPGSTRFNNGMSFISARILANGTVEFQYANGSTAVSLMNTKPTGTIHAGDWLQLVMTSRETASGSFTGTFSLIDYGPAGTATGVVVLAPVSYSITGLTNLGAAAAVSAGFRTATSISFTGKIDIDNFAVDPQA